MAAELQLGVGGAVGADFTFGTPIGSPVVMVGMLAGSEEAKFNLALESQPTLFPSVGADQVWVPLAMVTLGIDLGNDVITVGPYGTMGIISAGAGIRFRGLLGQRDGGGRHDLDVRAGFVFDNSAELIAMWTYRPWPR